MAQCGQPDRVALNALLFSAALAVLPHISHLPLWVLAFAVCLAGWRWYHLHRGGYLPGGMVRMALALVVFLGVYQHYGAVFGRDSGIALLTALLGVKFLELRTLRDYMLSVFLIYFLIFGAFLYSQSLWLGAYLLLAVTACTATLIRLNQPTGMTLPDALRLTSRLLLQSLPLMLALYLFFPRINGMLWGLPPDAYSGMTGLSDVLQPGNLSELSESPEIAMRVEFEGQSPALKDLYWRGLVLWNHDGRRWTRGVSDAEKGLSFPPLRRRGQPVKYTVTLEPSNQPWMPALDLPFTTPPNAWIQPGYQLVQLSPVRERLRYTLVSFTRYHTGDISPQEKERALQLPPAVSRRVQALAQGWRRQAGSDRDVVLSALDYFRKEKFFYTLKPPLLGDDPVDEFLFESRRGFCGHYASSFATLMRIAGIPARIITGYLGGEFNDTGNYLIVRQADAHAWVEVWLPERGWARVDPSAAIAPERVEFGIDAVRRLELQGLELGKLPAEMILRAIRLGWFERTHHRTRLYWDAMNLSWYRWVTDYDRARQEKFLVSLGFRASSHSILYGLLIVIIGAILAALAYFIKLRQPRADRVQALYLKYCRKLAGAGLARAPHEGPLAYARRSLRARPDLGRGIEAITQLYLRLRYGRAPVGIDAVRHLKHEVAHFKP